MFRDIAIYEAERSRTDCGHITAADHRKCRSSGPQFMRKSRSSMPYVIVRASIPGSRAVLEEIQIPGIKIISWDFLFLFYFLLKIWVYAVIMGLCGCKYSYHYIASISKSLLPPQIRRKCFNQRLFRTIQTSNSSSSEGEEVIGFKYYCFREAPKHNRQM